MVADPDLVSVAWKVNRGQRILCVLPESKLLEGVVREAIARTSLAGVLLSSSERGSWSSRREWAWTARTTSGPDGRYRLRAPVGKRLWVVVSREDLEWSWMPVDPFAAPPHDLFLALGPWIEGRIVDAGTGAGIASARLVSQFASGDGAVTDADGRFRMRRVESDSPWTRNVIVHANGHASAWGSLAAFGADGEGVLALPRSASVSGQVVESDGSGIGGCFVRLSGGEARALNLPEGQWSLIHPERRWTTTDGEGRFCLAGLSPSTLPIQVRVERNGSELHVHEIDQLKAGEEHEIVLRTPAGGSIHGIVRVNGEPRPALVQAWCDVSRRTRAAADGRYRLDYVPVGLVALRVYPGGWSGTNWKRHPSFRREVTIVEGEEQVVDWNLEFEPSTLDGIVVDERGNGLPAISLRLSSDSGHLQTKRSLADGSFHFDLDLDPDDPLPVALQLRVDRKPRSIILDDLASGAEDVCLVVPSLGTLRVYARNVETGELLSNVECRWRPSGTEEFLPPGPHASSSLLELAGKHPVPIELECGDVDLQVRAAGFMSQEIHRITVLTGAEPADVEVELRPQSADEAAVDR